MGTAARQSSTGVAELLREVVDAAPFRVIVRGRSGGGMSDDWWHAWLEPLRIEHVDYGLDATLIGSARRIEHEVEDLLADPDAHRSRDLALLLRLWLAGRRGELGRLVQEAALFYDFDSDEALS